MTSPLALVLVALTASAQPPATPTPTAPPATPITPAPAAATPPPAMTTDGPYRVVRTFDLGGEGSWDFVVADAAAHRLYIPRGTHVMVVDTLTGKTVGDIPDTSGVHGVAVAPEQGKGFTSNGRSNDVTIFDLATLKAVKTVPAGKGPDAIIFEPATKRIFVFNGKSNDATVLSAADGANLGTIALGGKPEVPVVDGHGKLFLNIENTSELVTIDAQTMKVLSRWPLAPGSEPSGLAFDAANHHLFSVCANDKMVVVDSQTGKVLASPTIGHAVDGVAFDAAGSGGGFAISSNGDGTATVVSGGGDKPFTVVQTLATAPRARTITLDAKTHLAYLPTADIEPTPAGEKEPKRPKFKPNTFKVVVIGPKMADASATAK